MRPSIAHKLPFNKVSEPVDYNNVVKLRSFENFHCKVSNSQLMKRLWNHLATDFIEELESGNTVTVFE